MALTNNSALEVRLVCYYLSRGGEPDDLYRDVAKTYGPAIERLARAYEADQDKRRDLSQNTHFELWRSFLRYDARCSLRTWVYRAAHHVAASHVLRERKVFSKLVSLEELEVLPNQQQHDLAAERRINLERLSILIQRLRPTRPPDHRVLPGRSGRGIDR